MTFAPPRVMPALRTLLALVVVAACTPRASAPRVIEHPLGESTAPGPFTPPPLAKETQHTTEVYGGPLTGAPATPAPTIASSPGAAAPPTSPEVAAPTAAVPAPVAAPTQYTGGTTSTVVQEPNARIPSTPSGVASETTAGTPSGVTTPASTEPATPSGAPETTNVPASPVPSGTPDVPATGVMTPPPPSEP